MMQELLNEEGWLQHATSDAEAALVGRWSEFSFSIQCDGISQAYVYHLGALVKALSEEIDDSMIVFQGSRSAWRDFLHEVPSPPNHHFLGMERRRSDFKITNGRDEYVRHLRLITRLFEIARDCAQQVGA